MFTLKIDTSNDAFTEDAGTEVARILREQADRIETWGLSRHNYVTDRNGNGVGTWGHEREED